MNYSDDIFTNLTNTDLDEVEDEEEDDDEDEVMDTSEFIEDDEVEDEEEYHSDSPSHLSNFDPELIRASLEVQYDLNKTLLQEEIIGIKELEQSVALLELSLEKVQAFRHATEDYAWRNEKFEIVENDLKYGHRRMQSELQERKERKAEDPLDFARRGLEGLRNGTLNVAGSYSTCWYGRTHPDNCGASDLSGKVRDEMRARGLFTHGWDSHLTPIETWGIDDHVKVENFLKTELPLFIERHQNDN